MIGLPITDKVSFNQKEAFIMAKPKEKDQSKQNKSSKKNASQTKSKQKDFEKQTDEEMHDQQY